MSIALLLLLVLLCGFALGLIYRRGGKQVSEPSCGKCGYCVRGLESSICPECGSDLRVVGILRPGVKPPMSRARKLLVWSLLSPMPTVFLAIVLMPLLGPQLLRTSQRRVIFSQVPYCNVIITANSEGKQLVFGNHQSPSAATQPVVKPELIFLSTNSATQSPQSLTIDTATNTYSYFDAAGKRFTGKLDAAGLEKWLNALGFTDPRVADCAKDIIAAVGEMGTPAGRGFTSFPNNAGIAHPTFTFTRSQPNEATGFALGFLLLLVWLTGLPWVLRRRTPATPTDSSVAPPAPALS
jgi:hypothetical protein